MLKINKVIMKWRPGDIHDLGWLGQYGVDRKLVYKYCKSGYLEKVGAGVYKKATEEINPYAVIRYLQEELELKVHISSKTALELYGHSHYLSMKKKPIIQLTSYTRAIKPKWLTSTNFQYEFKFNTSVLFKEKVELTKHQEDGFQVLISTRELAILEFLSKIELSNSFETAENYINGLQTLRPNVVQNLLEKCTSVKVKRVFLYLSEKLDLPYFKKLDLTKIDLGKGNRQVIKENGQLDQKYQITVPRAEVENPF